MSVQLFQFFLTSNGNPSLPSTVISYTPIIFVEYLQNLQKISLVSTHNKWPHIIPTIDIKIPTCWYHFVPVWPGLIVLRGLKSKFVLFIDPQSMYIACIIPTTLVIHTNLRATHVPTPKMSYQQLRCSLACQPISMTSYLLYSLDQAQMYLSLYSKLTFACTKEWYGICSCGYNKTILSIAILNWVLRT